MRNARLAALVLLMLGMAVGLQASAGTHLVLPPATASQNDGGQQLAKDAGEALIGRPGPALSLRTIDGETIDLAKLYGRKPVYLKFWATWCAPCRAQMPAFEKDYETLGQKMQFVAVNTGFNDNIDTVKAYRKALSIRMPIVIDNGVLAQALNLKVTPQHVVIGRDGRILYVGHLEDANLHKAFDAAMKEQGSGASGAAVATESVYRMGDTPEGLSATTLDATSFPLVATSTSHRPTVLVFFTPWCESYFKKTRPESSLDCKSVRDALSKASLDHGARWLGVASRLWTSEKDLQDYRKSGKVRAPLTLDSSGALFRAFDVRDLPTVILLDRNGRVAKRLDVESRDFGKELRSMGGAS